MDASPPFGFILVHRHLGYARLIGLTPSIVRLKVLETGVVQSFSLSVLRDGTVKRAELPPGILCEGPEGACSIVRLVFRGDREHFVYEVAYATGTSAEASEAELVPKGRAHAATPLMDLAGRDPDAYVLFQAREELLRAHARTLRDTGGLKALLSCRIDLRPHQAFVAGVVTQDRSRRYILADEVGLGKTIEAGIVITDLLLQKHDARVLIVCPGPLAFQWLSEIYSKFGGHVFRVLGLGNSVQDPSSVSRAILPIPRLLQGQDLWVSEAKWDLVIVDEAHHVLNSDRLFEHAQALSRRASSLLLLSAIPARRRDEEYLRLLALLEPDQYRLDAEAVRQFSSLFDAQTDIGRRLRILSRRAAALASKEIEPEKVAEAARRLLELPVISEDERLREMFASWDLDSPHLAEDVAKLIFYASDHYRVHRRILRNRRERLIEENQLQRIERVLELCLYHPDAVEREAIDASMRMLRGVREHLTDSPLLPAFARIVLQTLVSPAASLELLKRFAAITPSALNSQQRDLVVNTHLVGGNDWRHVRDLVLSAVKYATDENSIMGAHRAAQVWANANNSRIGELITLLGRRRRVSNAPKILVFASVPSIALEVLTALRRAFGEKAVTEFRTDLSDEQKEQNVLQFRTKKETWVLVSDESGGEGRNFQFASELVHFDTPLHLDRIEQRIGRVDRLGREHFGSNVVSHVLAAANTVESALVRCIDGGLAVYRRSLSGLEFALRKVDDLLMRSATADDPIDSLEELTGTLASLAADERAHDESESILDEASFQHAIAQRFQRTGGSKDADAALETAFVRYFDLLAPRGVKVVPDADFPNAILQFDTFAAQHGGLELPVNAPADGRYTGTFRRPVAQLNLSKQFFQVGNPLFDTVMRSLSTRSTARTYAVACESPGYSGSWRGLEFVFSAVPMTEHVAALPSLVARARELFGIRTTHVLIREDGAVMEDGERLIQLRRSFTDKNKDRVWVNLTKEKAAVLDRLFRGKSWSETVEALYQRAKVVAQTQLLARLDHDLATERTQVATFERQARYLSATERDAEIDAWRRYLRALSDWKVDLDSAGFLAVNTSLQRVA